MSVVVYSKPNCVQCVRTFALLDRKNIPYETVDLMENGDALVKIKEMGYLQAPVVVTDLEHWSGLNPPMINSLSA